MEWTFENRRFRRAAPDEIKALQAQIGAPHVWYACKCGHAIWTAKNLTLDRDGSFVPIRSIFYQGSDPECNCPPTDLVCVVEVAN